MTQTPIDNISIFLLELKDNLGAAIEHRSDVNVPDKIT
jgi:hypothetical protein